VDHPNDPEWVSSIGKAVRDTLNAVVSVTPEAKPIDLWATALQYALAAFGLTSGARSKMEVRRAVDQQNAILEAILTARLHLDPIFREKAPGYLALLAAASAVDLAGFELDPRMTPAIRLALGGTATFQGAVFLLDVREPGEKRDFLLRLAVLLMQGNLGSIGTVQNSADQVHQGHVDGLPLEVLPCITLYPGMEAQFGFAAQH